MSELLPAARRALRARAHHLHPVVVIGQHGLTPAVLHEIDAALLKHELIKVRVASGERVVRDALLSLICKEIECSAVQHLGRIFVLFRENPDAVKRPVAKPESRSVKKPGAGRSAKVKTGPRTPLDPVRERRRAMQSALPTSGKGRRGAARHQASDSESVNVARSGLVRGEKRRPAADPIAAVSAEPRTKAPRKETRSRKPRPEPKSKPRASKTPLRRPR